MKKLIILILVLIVLAGAGAIVMYSGVYNVGTDNHDNAFINWCLDVGVTRSVQAHAKGITVPPLTDPALVRTGCGLYAELCVTCHGAPGVGPGDISRGLWPIAPALREGVTDWTPAQLFWITKNGIKFTAMPAWGPTQSDADIWALVAFLQQQPQLSEADYAAMAKAAAADKPAAPKE